MDLEFIHGRMVVNTKDIGTMVNNTEKEFIDSQQGQNAVADGRKENVLLG